MENPNYFNSRGVFNKKKLKMFNFRKIINGEKNLEFPFN